MRSVFRILLLASVCVVVSLACLHDASRPLPAPVPPAPPPGGVPSSEGTDAVVIDAGGMRLESSYRPRAHQYRGQLHAHTTNSDGAQSPAAVMAAYRDHGYDFAAITDHDHNTPDPGVKGILFVPGVENDHTCLHENRIGATTVAPGARWPQDVIDQASREGSFVQINHPDWPGSYPRNPCWSDPALLAVHGYDAVEAWNNSNDPDNSNAERRIDFLLSHGRRTDLTAVDDCHDVRAAYCMVASTNVFADELSLPAVMAALKSGNFYASRGATFERIAVDGTAIEAVSSRPGDFEFVSDGGKVVKAVPNATVARYAATGDETYVRVRLRGPGQRMAWSNPIYVSRPGR